MKTFIVFCLLAVSSFQNLRAAPDPLWVKEILQRFGVPSEETAGEALLETLGNISQDPAAKTWLETKAPQFIRPQDTLNRLVILNNLVVISRNPGVREWLTAEKRYLLKLRDPPFHYSWLLNIFGRVARSSEAAWFMENAAYFVKQENYPLEMRADVFAALQAVYEIPEARDWFMTQIRRFPRFMSNFFAVAQIAKSTPGVRDWFLNQIPSLTKPSDTSEAWSRVLWALSEISKDQDARALLEEQKPYLMDPIMDSAMGYLHDDYGISRSYILYSIGDVALDPASRNWLASRMKIYVASRDSPHERSLLTSALAHLSKTPGAREWCDNLTPCLIKEGDDYVTRESLLWLHGLFSVPDRRDWFAAQVHHFILPSDRAVSRTFIAAILQDFSASAASRDMFDRHAARFVRKEDPEEARTFIIANFKRFRGVRMMGYLDTLGTFLCDPLMDVATRMALSGFLSGLSGLLSARPALQNSFRLGVLRAVNQARERSPHLGWDELGPILSGVRDNVTQATYGGEVPDEPQKRPCKVHFAASLLIPGSDGRHLPLYKYVEQFLETKKHDFSLQAAVGALHLWTERYAPQEKKGAYHALIHKGYGDGKDPDFNQEITPLLRPIVSYMLDFDEATRKAWLFGALDAATAAHGTPTGFSAERIQERLTILGFDQVPGLPAELQSLSKFAAAFSSITDQRAPTADNFIWDSRERVSLPQEKPPFEVFKTIMMPGLRQTFERLGLASNHVEALLGEVEVQHALTASLEFHHALKYAALRTGDREMLDPDED